MIPTTEVMIRINQNMKQKTASVYIVVAGILWGLIALFVRKLNANGFESMDIVLLRSMGAMLLMFFGLLFYDRSLFRIRLKDWWCFAGTGILSLTFFNWCYFKTIVMSSLSVASILLYTAPVIVVVLSAFLFHEKLTVKKVVCLFVAFIGCVLVTGILEEGGSSLSVKSILVGLGAGFGYALYSIFGRYAIERGYSSFTISFYTFLFSTIGTLPLVKTGSVVKRFMDTDSATDLLLIGGLALISTVLPYLLYTLGLMHVENGKASIMASIEPVVATTLGIAVFGETLSTLGVLGIVLVLGSVVALNHTLYIEETR